MRWDIPPAAFGKSGSGPLTNMTFFGRRTWRRYEGSSVLNMYYALPEKREEILSKFIARYFIDTLRALFDAAFLGRFLDDFLEQPSS